MNRVIQSNFLNNNVKIHTHAYKDSNINTMNLSFNICICLCLYVLYKKHKIQCVLVVVCSVERKKTQKILSLFNE